MLKDTQNRCHGNRSNINMVYDRVLKFGRQSGMIGIFHTKKERKKKRKVVGERKIEEKIEEKIE